VGVTYVTTVGEPMDSHEFRVLPNGDYLMFTDKITLGVDLTGLGGAGSQWGPDEDTLDCIIQEVTPGGELVWEWTGSDHIDMIKESIGIGYEAAKYVPGQAGPPPNDGGYVTIADPFHCNSIDWDQDGNLLVSVRQLDAILLVSNPATTDGHVIWKMGPPPDAGGQPGGVAYNKDGARYISVVNDPLYGFYRQHHARFAGDGGSTITVYDDRTGEQGAARGLQLAYDPDAGTASIMWQHSFPTVASANSMGSVTILSDGSHVVGFGYPPRGSPLAFTEVNPAGADVLDFYFPHYPESSYRALKYPASAVSLETLRKSIGPWSSQGLTRDAGPMDGGVDGARLADGSPDGARLADGGRKDAGRDGCACP